MFIFTTIQWVFLTALLLSFLAYMIFFRKRFVIEKETPSSTETSMPASEGMRFEETAAEAYCSVPMPAECEAEESVEEVQQELAEVLYFYPKTTEAFFDDFFKRAVPCGSLDIFTRVGKQPHADVCDPSYHQLHRLAMHSFPNTMPRSFTMTRPKGRAIAMPFSDKVSIILFEENGEIKIVMPEIGQVNTLRKIANLSFVPQAFDFNQNVSPKPLASDFAVKRYKELVEVQKGELHPVITYLYPGKDEKVGMVPGKLKGEDFSREVMFFNELMNQLPLYQGEFYARTMKSFYSAASIKSFDEQACVVENSNHIRFIMIKSPIPGYNVVLAKRRTNQHEYIQIVGVEPTSEEKVLIEKGERPFLAAKPVLFLLDENTPATQFVKDWVRRLGYLVTVF